jgi:conjugative relaxase-like TrwC/TraI family protein
MISYSQPIEDSQQCQYYLDMTQSDYYANRYEQAGYWAGQDPECLGLRGPVQGKQFQNLFDGFTPDGKTNLVRNAGRRDRQKALESGPNLDKSGSPC